MYHVPDTLVAQWENRDQVRLPAAIDINCSFCGNKVSFALQWPGLNDPIMSTHSNCPHCRKSVLFILVEISQVGNKPERRGKIYIYPSPKIRYPVDGIKEIEEFPSAISQAYISAINVYNVREWTATAVLCRRLLEGVAKTILPKEKQSDNLFNQIKALSDYRDLKQPITTLADAIRKGGNLGAHFDLERSPDEETTTLMLDLIESLIEYIFILPKQINHLHEKIDNIGNK